MLNSLYSAVSGLQSFQTGMDVIGNNIANSNTVAFKGGRAEYEDNFSQSLQAAGAAQNNESSQVGTGVRADSVANIFNQGTLTNTGLASDLGVSGDGFFIVRDPASGLEYATRAGNFQVTTDGYLATRDGYRVQGFSDSALASRGDVRIDNSGAPQPGAVVNYVVANDGKVTVSLDNGSSFVRGQVLLQRFSNPQSLVKEGSNLYSGIYVAGPLGGLSPQPEPPGTQGLGHIKAGTLEMSNVDLTSEFANLIVTQRAFQANARVMTTSDEILQELVNLKR